MIYLDKYANFSMLRELNPFVKVVLFLFLVTMGWLSESVLFSGILVGCVWGFVFYYATIRWGLFLRISLIPLGFALLGVVPILVTRTANGQALMVVNYWGFGVSEASLMAGLKVVMRSYVSLCALFLLVLTTPISHLLWLMRVCRFPELLIDLTALIYRNIFLILQVCEQLFLAQKSRLAYLGGKRNRHIAELLGRTFVLSVKKAGNQFDSLEARCYENHFRVIDPEFRMGLFYAGWFLVLMACLIGVYVLSIWYKWI